MSGFKDKSTVIMSLQQMIAGLENRLDGQTLAFDDTKVATADIVTRLQGRIADLESADVAYRQWRAARKKVEDGQSASDALVSGVTRYVRTLFGPSSVTLGEFGIEPFHPRKSSLAAKVAGKEKSQATRAARHTMGSRQREAIHGTVPATQVATAPAPSPTPAPVTQSSTSSSVPATPAATPTDKAA